MQLESILTNIIVPLLVSIISAWLTSFLTISSERKKMVNDVRRNAYMDTLCLLTKIIKNPIIIYDEAFMDKLQDIELSMSVYGTSHIVEQFRLLLEDVSHLHLEYQKKFQTEDYEDREQLRNDPIWGELIEEEEFDYKVQNMPDYGSVESIAKLLKEEITKTLMKG